MPTILRSLFPEPPGKELVARFREHVRATGMPETFEEISTTRPPDDGDYVTLMERLNVNPKTRADRAMAPCPICSPEKPKFLHDGRLVWSSATKAIYAIGPKCSTGLLEWKLERSSAEFRKSEAERRNAERLVEAVNLAAARQCWGIEVRDLSRRVEEAHSGFARDHRQLRKLLDNALKASVTRSATTTDGQSFGVVHGLGFLRSGWHLLADLNKANDSFASLLKTAGSDAEGWVQGLSPEAVKRHLAVARDAERWQLSVWTRLHEASKFLHSANVRILASWGISGGAPMNFQAVHTGSKVTIRTRDHSWTGPVGLAEPPPCPGHEEDVSVGFRAQARRKTKTDD